MTTAFWRYPICQGPLDQNGSGSGHATTWARATLELAIYEQKYVLQYIVINKLFANKQLILVFFLFSVALAQDTTGDTTATTMATAGKNGPLAPHMRPWAPRQRFKWMDDNPLSLWMYLGGGGLRVCMALKVLLCSVNDELPQHRSVLRAIYTLNSPQNYICLLRGCCPSI